jgi:hypothetical protein
MMMERKPTIVLLMALIPFDYFSAIVLRISIDICAQGRPKGQNKVGVSGKGRSGNVFLAKRTGLIFFLFNEGESLAKALRSAYAFLNQGEGLLATNPL